MRMVAPLVRPTRTIIGHRGTGSERHGQDVAENTIDAFARAFEQGVDAVETDLAMTADERMICFHDASIEVAPGRYVPVKSLTLEEIRKIQPLVPTLEELLESFSDRQFVFELKGYTDVPRILERWAKLVAPVERDRFGFLSFYAEHLRQVKALDQGIDCRWIVTAIEERFSPFVLPRHLRHAQAAGFEEISGHWIGIRPWMIRRIQRAGLRVGLGMINSARALRYCQRHRVSCLYTDRPAWVVANT